MADRMPWVEGAIENVGDSDGNDSGDSGFDMPSRLLGIFSATLGAITSFSLIVLIAIYFTLSPTAYVQNLLTLSRVMITGNHALNAHHHSDGVPQSCQRGAFPCLRRAPLLKGLRKS